MVGVRARTRIAGGHFFVFRHGMLFLTIPLGKIYIEKIIRARAPEFAKPVDPKV